MHSSEAKRIAQEIRREAASHGPDARHEAVIVSRIFKLYRPKRRIDDAGVTFGDLRHEVPEFPYLMTASACSPPLDRRNDAVFPLWFGRKVSAVPPVAALLEFAKSFPDEPCAAVFPRNGFALGMVAYTDGVVLPNRGVVLQARFPSFSVSVRSFVEWLQEVRTTRPPQS